MKAIIRRLRRLEHRMGLVESTAEREVRVRMLTRLEAGRRRVAAARGEPAPTGVRPPDRAWRTRASSVYRGCPNRCVVCRTQARTGRRV
jgi:hypothetical protein